ncbi:MAG: hypothetical protein L7T98_01495 [Candidatus Actinomarina sp.]|nr:hypothetical protein [Candidatus Actinomarina sp.]
MKKSTNIGLILFLLFQACSSPENTSEIVENPLPTDTPDSEIMPSPPPPGEQNSTENDKKEENPPPEEKKEVNNQELIKEALQILENPSEEIVKCIDNDVYGLHEQVKNGFTPDDYEAQVVLNCFSNPEYYGPIDGTSSSPPPNPVEDGENKEEENNNSPPASDDGVYEDYDNFYTYFGGPSNPEQREYLTYQYLGATDQNSIADTEAIFFGQAYPSDLTNFNNALYLSGWLQKTCPYDAVNLGEIKDLGLVIDYNTPGITAIPMNDPGFFSRDKGLETLADPSAVMLEDGTIALYFTGDHRASNQSSRWVTTSAITTVSDSISFQIESDYDLLTRLNWKNVFNENGNWTTFGALGVQDVSTWYKWSSTDGLTWTGETSLLTANQISERRTSNGYPSEGTASAYVTKISSSEYYAVFTGYREDFEQPSGTDMNGDGVVSGEYVIIYTSSDGMTWTYHDIFHGGSEGAVTKTASGYYVFTSTTGCTYLSSDAKNWGYGFNAMLYGSIGELGSSVLLDDGWRLVFGTSSNEGIPLKASKITVSTIEEKYLQPMNSYIPSIDEIEVPYEFNY